MAKKTTAAKPQPQSKANKEKPILVRFTNEQLDHLKRAVDKLADDVGLNASISAFCAKAAMDRAYQILPPE